MSLDAPPAKTLTTWHAGSDDLRHQGGAGAQQLDPVCPHQAGVVMYSIPHMPASLTASQPVQDHGGHSCPLLALMLPLHACCCHDHTSVSSRCWSRKLLGCSSPWNSPCKALYALPVRKTPSAPATSVVTTQPLWDAQSPGSPQHNTAVGRWSRPQQLLGMSYTSAAVAGITCGRHMCAHTGTCRAPL
jgi:hypothetical protein